MKCMNIYYSEYGLFKNDVIERIFLFVTVFAFINRYHISGMSFYKKMENMVCFSKTFLFYIAYET